MSASDQLDALRDSAPPYGTITLPSGVYEQTRTWNLSSRCDLTVKGTGCGVLCNSADVPGTVLVPRGAFPAITVAPEPLTQNGPAFENINVLDGGNRAQGWYVSNVNLCQWDRCSVKYAAKGWYFDGGQDNAWHEARGCVSFQCNAGLHCNANFGVRWWGGAIYVGTNLQTGVLYSGQAQNNRLDGTFIDGGSTGGAGNGTGISVDATGAHNNEHYGLKMEGLRRSVILRSPSSGPPTRAIKFIGGSMSAYAPSDLMVDIGTGVEATVGLCVSFPNSIPSARVKDAGTGTVWI